MKAKSNRVRDDYMRSMYEAVTVNLSHIASLIIMRLCEQQQTRIECQRLHKMLYHGIKLLQQTEHRLHRSLCNPEEYDAIINQGSIRLDQFLNSAQDLQLIHVEDGHYVLDRKLVEEFEIDEVRTENLINVYANEVRPLSRVTRIIDQAMNGADKLSAQAIADYRFNDQIWAISGTVGNINANATRRSMHSRHKRPTLTGFSSSPDRNPRPRCC